jgi:hypothetical protein
MHIVPAALRGNSETHRDGGVVGSVESNNVDEYDRRSGCAKIVVRSGDCAPCVGTKYATGKGGSSVVLYPYHRAQLGVSSLPRVAKSLSKN